MGEDNIAAVAALHTAAEEIRLHTSTYIGHCQAQKKSNGRVAKEQSTRPPRLYDRRAIYTATAAKSQEKHGIDFKASAGPVVTS